MHFLNFTNVRRCSNVCYFVCLCRFILNSYHCDLTVVVLTIFSNLLTMFFSDGLTPGDASESFTLQFGSISPGFMNGMQVSS